MSNKKGPWQLANAGGALILARANDGAALEVRHNYAWPPRAPAAAEMEAA